jgi:CRISPR/Cas system-associated exonuclease Cas4 (RecB family)
MSAVMPEPMHSTAALIYAMYQSGGGQAMADFRKQHGVPEPDNGMRPHLGASIIGRECEREIWYKFRWIDREVFDGRKLRLFETGHLEEPRLIANLKAIGVDVRDRDPSGAQYRIDAVGGHFGGSMDGVAVGVPEAPKTWHVCEFKTASEKSFKEIKAKGVKIAKPEHYAQMTVYMGFTALDRAIYIVKNKNTDELHVERVEFDADLFKRLVDKATRIIQAKEPPVRLSQDPTFWKCKSCPFYQHCHNTAVPLPTCRSCAHATPELAGHQRWSCAKWNADIPAQHQESGCGEHRFIPALLEKLGEPVDAKDDEVAYRKANGTVFVNGSSKGAYTSKELRAAQDKNAIGEPNVNAAKKMFGAELVA